MSQRLHYEVDGVPVTYDQPDGGVFFVESSFDDDEASKVWGRKTFAGFWFMVFFCNALVWPAAYAIKRLPGVRRVM